MQTGNVLEATNVSKHYPGVLALDNVEFDLKFGEVQALVGQNGAGKSTFIEIIAGSIRPDSGRIILDGRQLTHLDPALSIELGIQTVHQENQLVEELSVAENIYLYNLPINRLGFASLSTCILAANKLLLDLGIQIDSRLKLSELTFVEKKLISIAKAFSRHGNILILDEPTASLDETGKTILFDIIKQYTQKGLSVIYISHHLGEIFEICDRVTIFKDGRKVKTSFVKDTDMTTIVREMIGKSKTTLTKRAPLVAESSTSALLEVVDYSQKGVVEHVSFQIKKGEIFGLGGLVGAGRSELARLIFGMEKKDSGQLVYAGRDITPTSPSDAIRKGIGYLTEDRKLDGLVTIRPIFENISVVELSKNKGTFLDLATEKDKTEDMSQQLAVKTPSLTQAVINLSGGNQQKVVVAKWLYAEAQILIFDEPTVGIDVGSKSDIYELMMELAQQGKIIIMISSDNPELVSVCDRVGIMRFGQLVTILAGDQISEENILKFSLGVGEKD
ncbi:MAG: sugar ABC transporter ATP-binding protein [Desulfobacterales bacterium]